MGLVPPGRFVCGGLGYAAAGQVLLRMAFNILARNQDDHTRNFAFLMDPTGRWRLAPAYDLAYAYNPRPMDLPTPVERTR
jgi:hypothetical protein